MNYKSSLLTLAVVLLISGLAVPVHADDAGASDASSTGNGALATLLAHLKDNGANNWEDSVSRSDRTFYQTNDFGKFGVQFRPHARVCDASSGEVHCDARVVTDDSGKPLASATAPAGMSPAKLRSAYGVLGLATGTKPPVIAIVDAYDDPNIQKDLDTYSTQFGIPKLPACVGTIKSSATPCFQKVGQTGKTTSLPAGNASWDLEIALDVEAAHAMCQNCGVLLVEANSSTYANLMSAVDTAVSLGGNVVSNSYGGSESSSETTYDSHFNHPGVAFTVSSGDGGYGTEYPAASKYVTAVGGTSLFLNSDGTYNHEAAWSGAGSGCSTVEGKPTWQHDTSCAKRTIADVSADADPNTGAAVYDSVKYSGQSGWFQVGGTSLASPLIAATYALSGNIPAGQTESSLPYANTGALNDVTTGTNGTCSTYLCKAVAGYDGPTGLGSPRNTTAF